MRYHLEPTLHIGARRITVISRIHSRHHRFGRNSFFHGDKSPAYILLKDNGPLQAFDTTGAHVAWEQIETACPEIAATLNNS